MGPVYEKGKTPSLFTVHVGIRRQEKNALQGFGIIAVELTVCFILGGVFCVLVQA